MSDQTPLDTRMADLCLVRSTSTKCPTKKSRTSLSPPISRPENAWASRPLSRRSSKSLAKTCKSGLHSPVALGSRIQEVSEIIGNMRFLWLGIEDEPGPNSQRGYVERNSIALLSNHNKQPLDQPLKTWLGHYSDRERVRNSGLWNQNHVEETYDYTFLDTFDRLVVRKVA